MLTTSRVLPAVLMSCALLSACSLDRLPITSAELVSDGDDADSSIENSDAAENIDADSDASIETDASVVDANVVDANVVDANVVDANDAAEPVADAGADAAELDAYVPPPPRFAGPCTTDHDCELDESCLRSAGLINSHSYCAQRCTCDTDCDQGSSGADSPRCTSSGLCRLPCDALLGAGCPTSMVCQDLLLLLPVGDGTCSFER